MRDNSVRQSEIRLILIRHLKTINIFVVAVVLLYALNFEIRAVVDRFKNAGQVSLVFSFIPPDAIKRIVSLPCLATNNYRFICPITNIDNVAKITFSA